jgi:hypothetical protein
MAMFIRKELVNYKEEQRINRIEKKTETQVLVQLVLSAKKVGKKGLSRQNEKKLFVIGFPLEKRKKDIHCVT